jgi:hypothetical protein
MGFGPGHKMADDAPPSYEEATGGGGEKKSSSGDLSKRQGLITVNDLVYVLEPDLSVATNKTHKIQYFQQSSYSSGQNAICILNSGADYIDTRRSWLQFDVAAIGGTADTTNLYLGANGSACNFINQVTISTRSGDVLCQLFDFNLMQNILLPLTYDKQWFDTVGQTMMYGGGISTANVAANQETKNRMCIPMYILAPLFGYGRLMPAMLMSGLRVEIQFANSTQAFQRLTTGSYNIGAPVTPIGGAANTGVAAPTTTVALLNTNLPVYTTVIEGVCSSYTVSDAQFVLSSVQLSDSIQRSLNELSATNGLEIVYPDYERTQGAVGSDGTANIEIRKSCSRALKAFARVRFNNYTAAGIGPEENVDSFRAERKFPVYEYQWQLGSLYFPQQAVRSKLTTEVGCNEIAPTAYNMLLESFDAYHGGKSVALPYHKVRANQSQVLGGDTVGLPDGAYVVQNSILNNGQYHIGEFRPENAHSDGESGSFKFDAHSIGVTLERSTMFNLAGVPVNNSRVLAFHARLKEGTSETTPVAIAAGIKPPGNAIAAGVNVVRRIDIFLKYVKLCRVFLNNVEVEQ